MRLTATISLVVLASVALAQSQGGCPLCVAGGFGAGSALNERPKWLLSNVYVPDSATKGETFLWHNVDDRLQVGVAYLWEQKAFRGLANYIVIKEKSDSPSLRLGFGLQGISTGNPGHFAISEKSFALKEGMATAYMGIGFRKNENHGHLIGGAKWSPMNGLWTVGLQADGHQEDPFIAYRVKSGLAIGYYWIDMKTSGLMLSLSKL